MAKIEPNSCPTPLFYYDTIMPLLDGETWKMLTYAIRRIFGFVEHRESRRNRISLSQFVDGAQDDNGDYYDFGAGVSRPTAIDRLRVLVRAGLMVEYAPNNRRNQGKEYFLELDEAKIDIEWLIERHRATNAVFCDRMIAARAAKKAKETAEIRCDQCDHIVKRGVNGIYHPSQCHLPGESMPLYCVNIEREIEREEKETPQNFASSTGAGGTEQNSSAATDVEFNKETDSPIFSLDEKPIDSNSESSDTGRSRAKDQLSAGLQNHAPAKKPRKRVSPQSAMPLSGPTMDGEPQSGPGLSIDTSDRPEGRTTRNNGKSPKYTPEQNEAAAKLRTALEEERGAKYVGSLAARAWKEIMNELLPLEMSVIDLRNLYRATKRDKFWSDKEVMPVHLAQRYHEWVKNGRKMNGAAPYRDPATELEQPAQYVSTEAFW